MSLDASNKSKMMRWIRPLVFPYDDEQPKVDKLIVKHCGVNDKLSEIRTVKIPIDLEDNETLDGLITSLEMAMVDDAEGIGGLQRYVVFGIEKKTTISRLTLRYRGTHNEEDMSQLEGSEPPTEKGVTTALMRHMEARERLSVMGWGQIIQTQAAMIENANKTLEMYSGRFLEMEVAYQELLSMKHQRDLDERQVVSKIEMKEKLAQKAMLVLPSIAKRLGLSGIEGETNLEVEELRGVLQSLDESQFEAISRILKPEQMLAVASLMQKDIERTAKEKQEKNGKKARS